MDNRSDSVPAPMDANGTVVPLDTKELVYRGETREVCEFCYRPNTSMLGDWFVGFVGVIVHPLLRVCTMPDSWESLEEDARKAPRDYIEGRGITVGSDGRVAAMAKDLVRRARALAGVSDRD